MKIAIPTNDGVNITSNTKYLKGFKTYEIIEGKIQRENFVTGVNSLNLNLDYSGEHSITENPLVEAIKDCKIVISNGLDKKLFVDLVKAHKEVYITETTDVRIAVRRFVNQTLKNHPEMCV